jgi:hypothetical protein
MNQGNQNTPIGKEDLDGSAIASPSPAGSEIPRTRQWKSGEPIMDADDLRDLIRDYADSEREYHNSIDGSAAEKNALAERNEAMHCAITGFIDWVRYARRLGDKLAQLPPDFEWVTRAKPYRLNELTANYENEIRGLQLPASQRDTVDHLLRTFADTAWETAISEVTRAPRVPAPVPELSEALSALRDLMECPRMLDTATVPTGGIEVAPNQVVFNLSVGYPKVKRAKEIVDRASYPPAPTLGRAARGEQREPHQSPSPSSPVGRACRDCLESPLSQYGRLCDTHFMEAERKAMLPQDAPSREGGVA